MSVETFATCELPRIVYVGDVPVDASTGGSAFLFRLLETYPKDRLFIVDLTRSPARGDIKLPSVPYSPLFHGFRRPLFTRFARWYGAGLMFWSRNGACVSSHVSRAVAAFRPEAVLSVAHGFSWPLATRLASRWQVPLHLIIHDDAATGNLPWGFARIAESWFTEAYRQAASRHCVSPGMAEDYARRYGAPATVLFPPRSAGTTPYAEPPFRDRPVDGPVVFGYAGSTHTGGYIDAIVVAANEITRQGGEMRIYSPTGLDVLRARGLQGVGVTTHALLSAPDLVPTLRELVDVLFLPMSFDLAERRNMELAFPSKLSDYTATGLPLLVCGPPTSSVVRWARANPGVAEIADELSSGALAGPVRRLIQSMEYRHQLGARVLALGNDLFSHDVVVGTFFRSLRRHAANDSPGTVMGTASPICG